MRLARAPGPVVVAGQGRTERPVARHSWNLRSLLSPLAIPPRNTLLFLRAHAGIDKRSAAGGSEHTRKCSQMSSTSQRVVLTLGGGSARSCGKSVENPGIGPCATHREAATSRPVVRNAYCATSGASVDGIADVGGAGLPLLHSALLSTGSPVARSENEPGAL